MYKLISQFTVPTGMNHIRQYPVPLLQELNVSNHLTGQTCMHLLLLECTLHVPMTRMDYCQILP
jgi:hypothetical protein